MTQAGGKPRPRFKEALSSEEESPMMPVAGSKKEATNVKSGGAPSSGGSLNKKFRKSAGGGKPSFLTGRGIASATRFLNYRFLSLQTAGTQRMFAGLESSNDDSVFDFFTKTIEDEEVRTGRNQF